MKIFNIGLPELLVVLIIMLIFLGPDGMQENARKTAAFLRKVFRSETWKTARGMYHEVKGFPDKLMKEAEIDELRESLRREANEIDTELNSIEISEKDHE